MRLPLCLAVWFVQKVVKVVQLLKIPAALVGVGGAQGWAETSGRRVPDHAIWRRVGMTLVRPGGELLVDLRHSLENAEVGYVWFVGVVPLTTEINR